MSAKGTAQRGAGLEAGIQFIVDSRALQRYGYVGEGQREAMEERNAAVEAIGSAFESRASAEEIPAGRGADAVTLLITVIDIGVVALLGLAATPPQAARKALREWSAEARRLKLGKRAARAIQNLRTAGLDLGAVSADCAAALALGAVERAGRKRASIAWWDDIPIQPFEWEERPELLRSAPERLYFFIIDSRAARWYVVVRGNGQILHTHEQPIPSNYMDY